MQTMFNSRRTLNDRRKSLGRLLLFCLFHAPQNANLKDSAVQAHIG